MSKNSRGFTLIELLVVIFIIGLLASIVVVSVNTARTKARDARRIADVGSIRSAIEMYIDANGAPPNPLSITTQYSSTNSIRWNALGNSLLNFIPVLPIDPRNGQSFKYMTGATCAQSSVTSPGRYLYITDNTNYKIGTLLETLCDGTRDGGYSTSWYEIGSKPSMSW